jgi:multicomponent Na+:H+ antiporter subunit E
MTVLINVLLAIAWAAVTGSFNVLNLVFGFVLGAVSLMLIRNETGSLNHFRQAIGAAVLAVTFVWELIKSSINVAILVLSPYRKLSPAIIAYPLSVTRDGEITLLANMITLTPGTMSMDVSDDRSTLYIHAIDAPDPDKVIDDIKDSFEAQIMKVFNP